MGGELSGTLGDNKTATSCNGSTSDRNASSGGAAQAPVTDADAGAPARNNTGDAGDAGDDEGGTPNSNNALAHILSLNCWNEIAQKKGDIVSDARRTQEVVAEEMLKCVMDATGLPRL